MKKRKAIVLVVIAFIAVFISLSVLSMMPPAGANKECDTSEGGRSIAINGHVMWYTIYNEEGEGTPIYVLAGGPGFSSDYLEKYLKDIRSDCPIVFYDGRCSGRSEYDSDLSDCTYDNYAKDLEVLRKRLTPDTDIILIAHSCGGITAMAYAEKYAENIDAMVLISSAGYKTKIVFSDMFLHTGFPPFNQTYANAWFVVNIKELYGDFIANKEVEDIMNHSDVNYALMMKNEARDRYDYSDKLKKVEIPALILYGNSHDTPITGKEEAEGLHKLIKGSQLYQFKQSGHFCFAEEPRLFKTVVNDFINNLE